MENQNMNQVGKPANRPAKTIKYGGVRVSCWIEQRTGNDGRDFETKSVTVDRAYKDAQGQWQNTNSLREGDIPKAIAGLQEVFAYLCKREANGNASGNAVQPMGVDVETVR